jgi:hypothetical protein
MMIESAKFALFVAVSWALIIAPGPDMLFVITRGMTHGPKAGIVSATGVICGILVHTTAAALGITLIFQTSDVRFSGREISRRNLLDPFRRQSLAVKGPFSPQASISRVSSQSLFWQGVQEFCISSWHPWVFSACHSATIESPDTNDAKMSYL